MGTSKIILDFYFVICLVRCIMVRIALNITVSDTMYASRIHWVDRGTGTPKDRDEVNRREVCECDG